MRWVDPDNYHITLLFIGSTDMARIPQLQTELQLRVRSLQAFSYRLRRFCAFPEEPQRARVIAAMPDQQQEFARWHAVAVAAATATGLSFDARAFSPHLSVGRLGRLRGEGLLDASIDLSATASSLQLYQSEAGNYRPLFNVDCGGVAAR